MSLRGWPFPFTPLLRLGRASPLILPIPAARYVGHKNQQYKLDCCLSERDTHVVSCSEDGKVFFWDLVEVSYPLAFLAGASSTCLPQPFLGLKRAAMSSVELGPLRVGGGVSLCKPRLGLNSSCLSSWNWKEE